MEYTEKVESEKIETLKGSNMDWKFSINRETFGVCLFAKSMRKDGQCVGYTIKYDNIVGSWILDIESCPHNSGSWQHSDLFSAIETAERLEKEANK